MGTENAVGKLQARLANAPVIGGALVGALAYLLGFALTFVLVTVDSGLDPETSSQSAFEQSGVQITEFGDVGFPAPEPSTVEFVGWILYNAHFVDTVYTPQVDPADEVEAAPETINILSAGSTQIPALVYHLVPVVLLAGSGYLLARQADLSGYRDAIRGGLGIPLGYAPLALIGTLVSTTTATTETQEGIEATVTASPSLAVGVLATLVLSALFGVVGAILGMSEE